jgi:hypothetical protein
MHPILRANRRARHVVRHVLMLAVASVSALAPSGVRGQSADARSTGGVDAGPAVIVKPGSTGQVWAYSRTRHRGPNDEQSLTKNGTPQARRDIKRGNAIGFGRGFPWIPCPSSITSGPLGKGAFGASSANITSITKEIGADPASAEGNGNFLWSRGGTGRDVTELFARAEVKNHLLACGRAADPMLFDPGPNDIALTFHDILLEATPDASAAWGAEMHSTIPGFTDLFALFVGLAPSFTPDLVIEFVSHPLLGIDDAAFEALLRSRFAYVPGPTATATLTAPVELTIHLESTTSYEVDLRGDATAAATVPEPATLLLLLSSALLLTAGVRRRSSASRGTSTRR